MTISQYWIAYDFSDDRERARVGRCLSRYGQRLQKSVFHCVLDPQRLSRLEGELRALGCGSGAIALAPLAAPAWVLGMDGPDTSLAEPWAFTYFSHPAPDAQRVATIQNQGSDAV